MPSWLSLNPSECQDFSAISKVGLPSEVRASLSFFLLLYGMPAPSAERQHPEAWPASTYGHLREVRI